MHHVSQLTLFSKFPEQISKKRQNFKTVKRSITVTRKHYLTAIRRYEIILKCDVRTFRYKNIPLKKYVN